MFQQKTQIRVRYAETDQMGVVYYGNYPQYLEVGRVEALREVGFPYKDLENQGVMLPVLNLSIKYIRPATYDDLLTVTTTVEKLPATRIEFLHEIHNSDGQRITTGRVELVFVNIATRRPMTAPENFVALFRKHGCV